MYSWKADFVLQKGGFKRKTLWVKGRVRVRFGGGETFRGWGDLGSVCGRHEKVKWKRRARGTKDRFGWSFQPTPRCPLPWSPAGGRRTFPKTHCVPGTGIGVCSAKLIILGKPSSWNLAVFSFNRHFSSLIITLERLLTCFKKCKVPERIHICVWPSPFAVQLKLSQHC